MVPTTAHPYRQASDILVDTGRFQVLFFLRISFTNFLPWLKQQRHSHQEYRHNDPKSARGKDIFKTTSHANISAPFTTSTRQRGSKKESSSVEDEVCIEKTDTGTYITLTSTCMAHYTHTALHIDPVLPTRQRKTPFSPSRTLFPGFLVHRYCTISVLQQFLVSV